MEQVLELEGLSVRLEGRTVLEDISFRLAPGEILAVVGQSGSGKTTLLKAIMGLLDGDWSVTGRALFQGRDLLELPERELRRLRGDRLGMIFQDAGASLCPIRTVGAQIYESLRAHRRLTRAQARQQALELFEKLELPDGPRLWDSYPFQLSGGMNQRVGIAMAVLARPPVLLADEPTSALDVLAQRQAVAELLRLRQLLGSAVVLVTHDIAVARAMADRVLVLLDGKAVEYGSARQVLHAPQHPYTRQLLAAAPTIDTPPAGKEAPWDRSWRPEA